MLIVSLHPQIFVFNQDKSQSTGGTNFSPRREYVKNALLSGMKKNILIYMCVYLQIQQEDLLLLLGLEDSFNIIISLRKLDKRVCIYE